MGKFLFGVVIGVLLAWSWREYHVGTDEIPAPAARAEAKETAAPKSGLQKQKEEYAQKVEGEIEDLETEWDTLKAKADKKGDKAKAAWGDQKNELQAKLDAAKTKMKHLRQDSGEAWDVMKTGMDDALDDLRRSFKKAKAKYN